MTLPDEFLQRDPSQHPPTFRPDDKTPAYKTPNYRPVLRGTRATLFEDKLHGHG